ncbi:putative late blight resistance protein homolog R1B-14 [Salvia miltiorrhiza]|uniref:putative late blight resistance protein homolog R1B-14 n=1 Tax=Salvia miltiorrhiza TaxID=226208 RepID=UPI0025ABE29A|nr:putative late blight resistance protein homolog R1B-14 [Salvia miltiorrhiza]
MAYEALDNLQQTLHQILERRDNLLTHSKESASKTHEIIEYLFCEENISYRGPVKPEVRLANRLRELAARLESVVGDVVDCIKGKGSVSSLESTVGDVADYIKAKKSSISSITDYADVSSSSRSAITSSKDDGVVGFEEDVEVIKDWLLEGSSKLQVLPIVGRGDIGKTTLVKIVYDDASVMKHFHICAWVTISQDHSVERIVLNLLASMKGISGLRAIYRDVESEIPTESLIRKYLEYKYIRYLIVMDDIWSKKAWDDVKMLFPDAGNGSRIIVTTRLQDVAAYVNSSSFIRTMSLLDAPHSWNLLKQKVFGDKDIPIELEGIGFKIAKNCGGLPLSIVVAAGLLSKIKIHTRDSWKQIAANNTQLDTIICSSYTHLPNHSEKCFLYMAGFPEDYEIRASELINLWIVEGFLKHLDESKSLEEEGEDCLEDLVDKSLVLVTNRKSDGKLKSCSLHDIVREFCVRQAAKEKVILPVMDYLPTPILRRHFVPRLIKDHHSISFSFYDLHLKNYVHSSHIRTIVCIPKKGYKSIGVVEKFSSLRVLHVLRRNDHWDWEPGQVFDLVHLTYLASNIPSSIVPSAISKLQNLQTLIIYRSEVLLPIEIWGLQQLKHLIAFSFQPLPNPEGEKSPLENLQALSLAMDLVWSKRMVEMIPNIKKLGICYSKVKFDVDASYCLDNLKQLCRLEKLKLEKQHEDFSSTQHDELGWISFRQANKRLGGLNFPLQLRRLTLSGWKLPWSDMTIIGSLPHLQVLKLRNYACHDSYWKTSKGQFRELRYLLIDRSYLVDWTTEASHFPRLECLMLRQCRSLRGIPTNVGHILTLKLIEVEVDGKSSEYLLRTAKWMEEDRQKFGYESFQVREKCS